MARILTKRHPRPDQPRVTRTLSFRLLITFVLLMVVVIVVIATVTLSLLQRHLVSNLDDELKSSGTVVAGNALNTLASDINDTPDPSLLSDYYLSASVSTDPGGSTQLFTRVNTIVAQRYGIPAAAEDLLEEWDGSSQVFTDRKSVV